MAVAIPKTKADELLSELSDLSLRGIVLSDFSVKRYLIQIDQLLKSGVEAASLWNCKGFVYSVAHRPIEMVAAFQNAQKLGASDAVSLFNQASQYILFGYYEEALRRLSYSHDDEAQKQFIRSAVSTFNYELIEELEVIPKTAEEIKKRKERLYDLNIDISSAKKLMDTFFYQMRSEKIRFGLVRHEIIEDEYILFFEGVADIETTHKILNKFDFNISEDDDLLEISQKITVILTPVTNAFQVVAA